LTAADAGDIAAAKAASMHRTTDSRTANRTNICASQGQQGMINNERHPAILEPGRPQNARIMV
jgi:hypothetical protein